MFPLTHVGRDLGFYQTPALEQPQHPGAHRALHGGDVRRTEQPSFVKLHPFPLGIEDTLDDRAMTNLPGADLDRGSDSKGEIPGGISPKCRLALSAEPKWWTKVTAPKRAGAGAPGLDALSHSSTASRKIRNTGPMSAGSWWRK
jgi:hypothetical protein